MARFIELTYYEHNRTFPEKSGGTGKKFFMNTDDISTITPYEKSTKVRHKYTNVVIEVVETYEVILAKLKGG